MPKNTNSPSYMLKGANNVFTAVNRRARRASYAKVKAKKGWSTFKESIFSIPEIFPRGMKGLTKSGHPWYPGMDPAIRDLPETTSED